jgi:hypothetical protein
MGKITDKEVLKQVSLLAKMGNTELGYFKCGRCNKIKPLLDYSGVPVINLCNSCAMKHMETETGNTMLYGHEISEWSIAGMRIAQMYEEILKKEKNMKKQTLEDYSFYLHIPKEYRIKMPSEEEREVYLKKILSELYKPFDRVVVRWIGTGVFKKRQKLMAIQIFGWIASNSPNYKRELETSKWKDYYEKPLDKAREILKKNGIITEVMGWADTPPIEELEEKNMHQFADYIKKLR